MAPVTPSTNPVPTQALVLVLLMGILAGCAAPGDDGTGDGGGADGPTDDEATGGTNSPEGAWFEVVDGGPEGSGNRAAVGRLDGDDRYALFLGGADGGGIYKPSAETRTWAASAATGGRTEDAVEAAVIGDLGDDGRHEVVLANEAGIVVLDNEGSDFARRAIDAGDMAAPRHLALADLDNDGWLDVVVADAAGVLHALFNDGAGDGALAAPMTLLGGDALTGAGFVLLDVDDDLLLDVVAASADGGLTLWLNQPGTRGGFEPRGQRAGLPVDTIVGGLFPADLDNDRRIDLVAATDAGLRFFENTGRVSFRDETQAVGLPDEGVWTTPAAADLDLDGWQDVVALDDQGRLRLFWNAADEGFVEKRDAFAAGPGGDEGGYDRFVAADLDRDGTIDLMGLRADAAPTFFRNTWDGGVWFTVHLIGNNATTTGIGSKVELTIGASFPMFRQVGGVASPGAAVPLDAHFGFGGPADEGSVSEVALVILWPSGTFQGRDIPPEEARNSRVTARENTEELTWDEGGAC